MGIKVVKFCLFYFSVLKIASAVEVTTIDKTEAALLAHPLNHATQKAKVKEAQDEKNDLDKKLNGCVSWDLYEIKRAVGAIPKITFAVYRIIRATGDSEDFMVTIVYDEHNTVCLTITTQEMLEPNFKDFQDAAFHIANIGPLPSSQPPSPSAFSKVFQNLRDSAEGVITNVKENPIASLGALCCLYMSNAGLIKDFIDAAIH